MIITSAGNRGDEGGLDVPHTVGDPATAKNVITVGAQDSWGSSLKAGEIGPGYVADFSSTSRGPTADGRIKPDIMAPGHYVLSAGAQPTETNECDSDPIPDPGQGSEGLMSMFGTSMAAPVVSASAAKIRQWFSDGYHPSGKKNSDDANPNPTGALIKAVLMNGAQPLSGVDNVVKGGGITKIKLYDNNQGFGRLSLQDSVYLHGKTNVQLEVWDRERVTDGGTNKYDVTIDKSNGCQAEDLSVTLVWTDPGIHSGCVDCLVHDLDLSVSFRGKTHYPNGRRSPDRKNNVERVIINGVQHGETATISVNAHNIAAKKQSDALVATACFGGVANKLDGEKLFADPTRAPSSSPTKAPTRPTKAPTRAPSSSPTKAPSESYFTPTPVYQGPSVYAGQYNSYPYFNPSQNQNQNRYNSNQSYGYGQNQGYFDRGYNQGYNGQHGFGYGQLYPQQGYGGDYTYQRNPFYNGVPEYQPNGWQNDAWGGGGQVSNIGHGVSQNRGGYGSHQGQGGGYEGGRYGYDGGQPYHEDYGYYNPAYNQGYGYSQPNPYYNNQYNNRRNGGYRRLGKESMEEEAVENEAEAGAVPKPITAAAATSD